MLINSLNELLRRLVALQSQDRKSYIFGPPASGKSLISTVAQTMGFPVLDLDTISQAVETSSRPLWVTDPFAIPENVRIMVGVSDNILNIVQVWNPDTVIILDLDHKVRRKVLTLRSEDPNEEVFRDFWVEETKRSSSAMKRDTKRSESVFRALGAPLKYSTAVWTLADMSDELGEAASEGRAPKKFSDGLESILQKSYKGHYSSHSNS